MIFYFIDDTLVKCKYKHPIKSDMHSDNEYFLSTMGIEILNNRNY